MLEKFISSLFVAEFTDICKFGCFTLVKQGYRIKVITIRLVCKYNNYFNPFIYGTGTF